MMGLQWHYGPCASHCTSLQIDNHNSTLSFKFVMGWMLFLLLSQQRQSGIGCPEKKPLNGCFSVFLSVSVPQSAYSRHFTKKCTHSYSGYSAIRHTVVKTEALPEVTEVIRLILMLEWMTESDSRSSTLSWHHILNTNFRFLLVVEVIWYGYQ